MIDWHGVLELIHILSASVLFGSGAAIAFFMLMAWRSGDVLGFALAAKHVVIADWLFTSTAVIVQPISGIGLALTAGYPLISPWLLTTYGLYVFIGACWLPVVWIQLKVRDLAQDAADRGEPIPARAHKLMRVWFLLGWPAFLALIGIFALMVFKPAF
jgi:uncharacterized membrane protein